MVRDVSGTASWYAMRLGRLKFGIFDTFEDQAGRTAHVSGKLAQSLSARAEELFSEQPRIEMVDILAEKRP